MDILIIIGIVVLVLYFYFKKKETPEQKAAREEREYQERQFKYNRVKENLATRAICSWLVGEFSDLDGECVFNLRRGYFYRVIPSKEGIMLELLNKKNESIDLKGASFAGLGYEDLPDDGMLNAFRDILREELQEISHIKLSKSEMGWFLVMAGDNIKQGW